MFVTEAHKVTYQLVLNKLNRNKQLVNITKVKKDDISYDVNRVIYVKTDSYPF